jgi:hypothetical protein
MSYHSLQDFALLIKWVLMRGYRHMQLQLAALKFDMILGALKCFVDILSLPATFILEGYLTRGVRADL